MKAESPETSEVFASVPDPQVTSPCEPPKRVSQPKADQVYVFVEEKWNIFVRLLIKIYTSHQPADV